LTDVDAERWVSADADAVRWANPGLQCEVSAGLWWDGSADLWRGALRKMRTAIRVDGR
jgi:hypothetical protein